MKSNRKKTTAKPRNRNGLRTTSTKKVSRKAKAKVTASGGLHKPLPPGVYDMEVSPQIFFKGIDVVHGCVTGRSSFSPPKPPRTFKEAMTKLERAEAEIKRLQQDVTNSQQSRERALQEADFNRAKAESEIHRKHSDHLVCILENFSRSKVL